MATSLNQAELRRYARHVTLPEVGLAGQERLRASRVLCVGAGGLGSPLLLYLAAAGIGRLGIVDHDRVDESNLQRQILHRTESIGQPKTESARDTLRGVNPHVEVVLHQEKLTKANALVILREYDIVVDGTDNFPTRYLTNDACVLLGKPNIYGSIFRFEGQASVFDPSRGGPCYRCLFPEPPPAGTVPNCAEGGVLGVLPGLVGCIQATETIKLALGRGQSLLGRMLLVNALDMKFREIKLRRDPACPLCGEHPSIRELQDYDFFCSTPSTSEPPMLQPDEVSVQDMKQALADPTRRVTVIDVRESAEYAVARVEGTVLLPLSTLPQRYAELDPQRDYYLHCKAGVRSMKAVQFLKQQGFTSVKSVQGGIAAWSEQIDPSVPRY